MKYILLSRAPRYSREAAMLESIVFTSYTEGAPSSSYGRVQSFIIDKLKPLSHYDFRVACNLKKGYAVLRAESYMANSVFKELHKSLKGSRRVFIELVSYKDGKAHYDRMV